MLLHNIDGCIIYCFIAPRVEGGAFPVLQGWQRKIGFRTIPFWHTSRRKKQVVANDAGLDANKHESEIGRCFLGQDHQHVPA